jgi:hypothetical protein
MRAVPYVRQLHEAGTDYNQISQEHSANVIWEHCWDEYTGVNLAFNLWAAGDNPYAAIGLNEDATRPTSILDLGVHKLLSTAA